ncbi:MAG: hypothetical protein NC094_13295 [Bacteroidales bacterium]|nr:hypothetical protein [Lachnoclostridium sp.]MCM1383594.1 hypothetical protein [Lachnoclostridium sp.]MCM1466381.1 hypothetical protein [Bacteroidales bacterium]
MTDNTFLVALPKPEATLVAGFKAWQTNFKRHVNKGESGKVNLICIFAGGIVSLGELQENDYV